MEGNEIKRLEQKVALIVGCGGYIADAIAVRLAEEKAAMILAGYTSERLEQTANDIRTTCGVEVVDMEVELTNHKEIKRNVESALRRFGKIDILVNAAWGHKFGLVGEFGEENWDHDRIPSKNQGKRDFFEIGGRHRITIRVSYGGWVGIEKQSYRISATTSLLEYAMMQQEERFWLS